MNRTPVIASYFIKTSCLVLCLFSTSFAASSATLLQEFHSDGCSFFPNGTWSKPKLWCHCCVQHDLAYWQGGSNAQRKKADQRLAHCVQQAVGKTTATLMYFGVRIGGSAFFPTQHRWGYGWPFGRGYQPLNAKEQKQVNQLSNQKEVMEQYQHHCGEI